MKRLNENGFKMILQSTQDDIHDYLSEQIPEVYGKDNCVLDFEFIFAKGELPVLLCCHMDTVHKDVPKHVLLGDGLMWSPEGIGGDDRCGIYSVLYLISHCGDKKPGVLFTTQEEVGCVGAKAASGKLSKYAKDFKFVIELDRKGEDDCVFYECKNAEFQKFIESYGFKTQTGSSSDIAKFCPSWNVAGVNLSIGYYNEHTKNEYIVIDDMFKTIDRVKKILDDSEKADFYTFTTKTAKTETKTDKPNKKKEEKEKGATYTKDMPDDTLGYQYVIDGGYVTDEEVYDFVKKQFVSRGILIDE